MLTRRFAFAARSDAHRRDHEHERAVPEGPPSGRDLAEEAEMRALTGFGPINTLLFSSDD